MQDIGSILTSLHAMEADLAPTTSAGTNELHSTQEHYTRQLLSAPLIPWDIFYKNHSYTKKKWEDQPLWVRYPLFLELYDEKRPQQQQQLDAATQNFAAASTTAAKILETQTQLKEEYDKTVKLCYLLCNTVEKLDLTVSSPALQAIANSVTVEYEDIKEKFDTSTQTYSTSFDTRTQALEHQMEAAKAQQTIDLAVCELDERRHEVLVDICRMHQGKKNDILQHFTSQQIIDAQAEKGPALITLENSRNELAASTKKIKATNTLQSKANTAKKSYEESLGKADGLMNKIEDLMPAIKKAAEAPSAVQAPLEHILQEVAQLDNDIKEQEEIRDETDDAAAAEIQRTTALVLTNERALVAERVELSATQLLETQAASAVQEKSASRIVALHEAQVELLQSAVEEADKEVEVAVQQRDAGEGSGILAIFSEILFGKQKNAAQQRIDAAAASSALQTAVNDRNKQHIDAYTAATSCAEQCQQAVNAAADHVKAEVNVYTDMMVASLQIEQNLKEFEALRANCMAQTKSIDERAKIKQVSDEEYESTMEKINTNLEKIQRLQQSLEKKQQQESAKEAVQVDINTKTFDLYYKAEENFNAAQIAQNEAWKKLPSEQRIGLPKVFQINGIIPQQHIQAMIDEKVKKIFPNGLPFTDIDSLAAKKIDSWKLKIDKNSQDLAMLHKLESEMQAMTKAQECVAKAQALRTSIQNEIEDFCKCTIEIETISKEQPNGQPAQITHARLLAEKEKEALRLDHLIPTMQTTLTAETASANAAIDELVRVTTDQNEIESFQAMTILPLDARVIIAERLSSMRALQNTTAAAAATAAAATHVLTEQEKRTAEKQRAYEQAQPVAMAALDLAKETKKPIQQLCDEVAELELNEIDINAKISYFSKFSSKTKVEHIPDMLAFCTQAKDKNDIQLRNLRTRAAAAKTANDNAIQAAIDQVQHMTKLAYDQDTQRVWRDGNHIPPEKFKWPSQLQQATKSEKKLRIDMVRVKMSAFSLCSQKLKEQEHVLTPLMNRFLDYDATYDAAEAEYKKKKAQFDTDQSADNKAVLEAALHKLQGAEYDRTAGAVAEKAQILECTATRTQAIDQGTKLLSLTPDGSQFQGIWQNLHRWKTDYKTRRDTIKLERENATELDRKLDARRRLITEAVPLEAAFEEISRKFKFCFRQVVVDFNDLQRRNPRTLRDRDAFRQKREEFDKGFETLHVYVKAYNTAVDALLEHGREICLCMGDNCKDQTRALWVSKCSHWGPINFDRLLRDGKIDVSSILHVPAEAPMQQPQNTLVPLPQPPHSPIVAPTHPLVLPDAQSFQPGSSQQPVRPSDAPQDSHNAKNRRDHDSEDGGYSYDNPLYYTAPRPSPCSFKQSMLAFAARLLPLVYPPTRAPAWLARPAVARYAHPDRARTAGGSLELHALCARVAHIALLLHFNDDLEPLAAHRLVVEVPENSRLLLRAVAPLPHDSLYAARAAPSREHKNSAAIRECLSRSSLQPLRACAAAQKGEGASGTLMNQSSQQYV